MKHTLTPLYQTIIRRLRASGQHTASNNNEYQGDSTALSVSPVAVGRCSRLGLLCSQAACSQQAEHMGDKGQTVPEVSLARCHQSLGII
jgi:hypothetical protein